MKLTLTCIPIRWRVESDWSSPHDKRAEAGFDDQRQLNLPIPLLRHFETTLSRAFSWTAYSI
jgi:hypothetical protein